MSIVIHATQLCLKPRKVLLKQMHSNRAIVSVTLYVRELCTYRFSLPYKHLLPSEKAASTGDMWNCEMSMLDVDKRGWMLGPMYNMQTGQLMVSGHAAIHANPALQCVA